MTETRTAHDVITDVVSTWRGTEAGTGSRGEWSFTVGRKEIGHLHGSHAAHFAFPKGVWRRAEGAGHGSRITPSSRDGPGSRRGGSRTRTTSST